MTDFQTARAGVATLAGLHPLAGVTIDIVNHVIVQAISVLERRVFRWNTAALSITPLVVGIANSDTGRKYALPADYLAPVGPVFLRDTSETTRNPLVPVDNTTYEGLRAEADDANSDPTHWALIGEDLWVNPAPDATTWELIGRYIKRLGIPTYSYVAPDWTWSTDSFTSDWFVAGKGLELVISDAVTMIKRGALGDLQGSVGHQQNAAGILAAAMVNEEKRTNAPIPGYFYGD